MASKSITNLARAAESAKRTAANMRRRAKEKEAYMLSQGEVAVGGALGGVLDGTMGEGGQAEFLGLPLVLALGGAMSVLGFTDIPGSEHAGHIGVGLLSYGLGNMVRDQIQT